MALRARVTFLPDPAKTEPVLSSLRLLPLPHDLEVVPWGQTWSDPQGLTPILGGADIRFGRLGMVPDNVGDAVARPQQAQDALYGYACPRNDRLAHHHVGIALMRGSPIALAPSPSRQPQYH